MTKTSPAFHDAGQQRRYSGAAMALHWAIALLILAQIGLGWWMNEVVPDHTPIQEQLEGLHISLGLTTMLLIAVRIAVRLVQKQPPLSTDLAAWERLLAVAGHLLFYLLMIALPLTGWIMISARADPISFWGLAWPRLPGLEFLAAHDQRPLRHALQNIHTNLLIWVVLANLALHVAGALKHQFGGHPVLWRMSPFGRR